MFQLKHNHHQAGYETRRRLLQLHMCQITELYKTVCYIYTYIRTTPRMYVVWLKKMRLATLFTNRECCCLPLHMAVRLTLAVDSVQF